MLGIDKKTGSIHFFVYLELVNKQKHWKFIPVALLEKELMVKNKKALASSQYVTQEKSLKIRACNTQPIEQLNSFLEQLLWIIQTVAFYAYHWGGLRNYINVHIRDPEE